jgi:hypothetical protein
MRRLCLATALAALATAAAADPLKGKSYIIQLSSTQYSSGYGNYLVPPLASVLRKSGMRAVNGPGADLVINVETSSDVGQWAKLGAQKVWLYTISATVGISPESYSIPYEGTPAFGITAHLKTPNPDRQDEMDCLIKLAARTALANYRSSGIFPVDGSSCMRK